jgi:hypothetical protein
VIDGRFTGDEWARAIRLEGLLTDVYLDYQAPYLFMLNDWRVNREGIRPACYNEFRLTIGCDSVDLKVYGDGHAEVTGATEVAGGYSVSYSPAWPIPHTIWEFQLAVNVGDIEVDCLDPVTLSTCEELTQEPVRFLATPSATGRGLSVARLVPASVPLLPQGASCGTGAGVCATGLSCTPSSEVATCQPTASADPGIH